MSRTSDTTLIVDVKLYLRWLAVLVFAGGILLAVFQIVGDQSQALRHPAVLSTAWVSFALWSGAVGLILPTPAAEWQPTSTRFRVARWTWALGAAMFVIHFGVACHFAHQWQHAKAYQHVAATAGFGPGIFVSYLFTVVWVVDAAWWVFVPASYANRSRWLERGVHGFMAFIMFNGTVVYVSGWIRGMAAGVFVVLGITWLICCLKRRA